MRSYGRVGWSGGSLAAAHPQPRLLLVALVLAVIASALVLVGANQPADAAPGDTVRFAAVGDYGYSDGPDTQAVADLVDAQAVDLVITTGDNTYGTTSVVKPPAYSMIDWNVGKPYSDFIGSYIGAYGTGSPTNRFFPTAGNHDYEDGTGIAGYLAYFTLPGNELYYDFVEGPVHFFALDSNEGEPGVDLDAQKTWLQAQLAASTSPWNVVYFHHVPYSSSTAHGSNPNMQWPFEAWGADAVLGGHDHVYERILRDENSDGTDIVYLTSGAGGRSLYDFGTPLPGSEARYNGDYGTVIAEADEGSLTFEFWSVADDANPIDSYTLNKPIPDTTPPVITLLGQPLVTLTVGDSYADAGATAVDDVDGDITGDIVVVGDVIDTSTAGNHTVTYDVEDAAGNPAVQVKRTVKVEEDDPPPVVPGDDMYGLVDPSTGIWRLRNQSGAVSQFYYGNPGDSPFVGDWNCDGVDTPGLYRQSDGFAYLRNSNSQGVANLTFFFGNPGDVPLAGDFNGDGCDTLSIYRPAEARFYIINKLGRNGGGLGAADYSFLFGNAGDKPVVGDWDGDGIDEIGLHRESSGFFYYRNTLTTGIASGQFYFGDPGDRFVSGDWGVVNGVDTPAVYRPSNATFYFRHTLTQGIADAQRTWPGAGPWWLPVAGDFDA